MCGELDEQALIGGELADRLRVLARRQTAGPSAGPLGLDAAEGRAAYLEAIFRDGLAEASRAVDAATEDEAIDALALRAIALARLAGVLAGQLPPEADLFRAVIEAVTAGHGETREAAARMHHDHHHR